jgi:dTDP-4-amino-4,6-dideoxygalactose transaminase
VERIPFVDLGAGTRPLRAELLAAITAVVDSGAWVGGPAVGAFEQAFAAACGTSEAAAVKTGTDALVLALRALGVGPGHEVITAANSFFATAEAIVLVGATPVFADVDDTTLLIDPARVAEKIGEKTRAIVPVHLYGQCADVDALRDVAARRGAGAPIAILEDACQAHGATRHGARAGSLGDAAAFSFYPTKNLGALGEGGAITTKSSAIAAHVRRLRDHGQRAKHEHVEVGYNARLDALQCAALGVKLAHLDAWGAARRRVAAAYREDLAGAPGIRLIGEAAGNEPVYHLFVVRVNERDRVRAALAAQGIDTAIHYPTPIHRQPAFAHLGLGAGSLPTTERATSEILSLPMYPELGLDAVGRVCAVLREAVRA